MIKAYYKKTNINTKEFVLVDLEFKDHFERNDWEALQHDNLIVQYYLIGYVHD